MAGIASAGLAAAGPAFAKGGIWVSAAPHSVRVGQTIHVNAAGHYGDGVEVEKYQYQRACIQQRLTPSGPWHTVKCGKVINHASWEVGVKADANVKALRHGTVQFRGVLYGAESPHVKHPAPVTTSEVATVRVR
ncbi:hypothetical protein [Streptomyces sp. NPDC017529]|uniref:hypothetical protein n=1 Tax=Streptomyces sp. NPDC017529 TaxID=3365000 RepID=UPI0037A0D16F